MCTKESHFPLGRTHLTSQVPQLHPAGFKDQTIHKTQLQKPWNRGQEEWGIEISPPKAQGHFLCPQGKVYRWPEATSGEKPVPRQTATIAGLQTSTPKGHWQLFAYLCVPFARYTENSLAFHFSPNSPFLFLPPPQRISKHAGEIWRGRRKK